MESLCLTQDMSSDKFQLVAQVTGAENIQFGWFYISCRSLRISGSLPIIIPLLSVTTNAGFFNESLGTVLIDSFFLLCYTIREVIVCQDKYAIWGKQVGRILFYGESIGRICFMTPRIMSVFWVQRNAFGKNQTRRSLPCVWWAIMFTSFWNRKTAVMPGSWKRSL